MKRLLTVAVFALLACAGMATTTKADSFGLFYGGRHGYDGAVSIRPYNAFSPVLYGDVPGYNGGGCGAGGCGQGAYGPIAYRHGCANGNCGQGGCGPDGCGQGGYGYGQGGYGYGQGRQGYGWGYQGGDDYRLRMMNLNGPANYTGALGYNPPDGYGNGAFGNYGLGRISVFGMPVDGGCLSCPKNYWTLNTVPAPMTCGPQGCAPAFAPAAAYAPNYGPAQAPGYAPSPTPSTVPPSISVPMITPDPLPMKLPHPVTPDKVKPPLIPVPNRPRTNESAPLKLPISPVTQGWSMPTQPVSYNPGYYMPYNTMQPMWGYYGYPMPTYPTWGYQGR